MDPRPEDPSRPPGRRYRRRRPGEPVSQEWAGGAPPPGNPLAGVLGETWQEYRRHAARLLPFATAGIVVAGLGTEFVRLAGGRFSPLTSLLLELPAAWLLARLAGFLLQAVTVGLVHQTRAPYAPPPARLRECLGEVTGAWLVSSFAVLGGLLLLVIPGVWLSIMWTVCVPVIVIERAGPLAALGRSRELIRGYGWGVLGRVIALGVLQSITSNVLRAAFSWLPPGWRFVAANSVTEILFLPAAAVMATVIYYRLTAAEAAAYPG